MLWLLYLCSSWEVAKPLLPSSSGANTQLCSPVLEQGTGSFPSTSMAKLQLPELGDFLPLSPCFPCETFRNQSFNPFLCLWVIYVCWAHSSFTPLSQQGTLSIGGKEVTLEYTPCPEFWRCKRVSIQSESCVVLPLLALMVVAAERSVKYLFSGWISLRVIPALKLLSLLNFWGFACLVFHTAYECMLHWHR